MLRCITVLVLAFTTPAQDRHWVVTGRLDSVAIAAPVVFVGDVDRDGYQDIAGFCVEDLPRTGHRWATTHIRSGRDGSTLRSDQVQPPHMLWKLTRAGDFDGDGVKDYAVSSQDNSTILPNRVEVYGSATGDLLWWVEGGRRGDDAFGESIASDFDLDGDGLSDVVVSAPRANNDLGEVLAFDHSGRLLHRVPGRLQIPGGAIWSVAGLGDLDDDGCSEFAFGAFDGVDDRGAIHIFSGRTGRWLRTDLGDRPVDGIGIGMIRPCGDFDRDGVPDYVATSPYLGGFHGCVDVRSGATGRSLRAWRGVTGTYRGWFVASGDFDQDGVPDFAFLGTEPGIPTIRIHIELLSGRDGTSIGWARSLDSGIGLYGFDAGEPWPGDAFPTLCAPEFNYGPYSNNLSSKIGALHLYRSAPGYVEVRGSACQGSGASTPRIGFREMSSNSVRIHLSDTEPTANGYLLVGTSTATWGGVSLPLSLDPFGLARCSLWNSVLAILPVRTGTTGLDRGYAYLDLPRSAAAKLHAQWIVLDSRGFSTSASLGW